MGGQGCARSLLAAHGPQQRLAVRPPGILVRAENHLVVARQLQICAGLLHQQIQQRVEPVQGVGRQQRQLIPQVPPPVVGQLVAQDEGQRLPAPILPRQVQAGPQQSHQHGRPHRAADSQGRRFFQPHVLPDGGVNPRGFFLRAPAPPSGLVPEQPRSRQDVQREYPRAAQPYRRQKLRQGPGPPNFRHSPRFRRSVCGPQGNGWPLPLDDLHLHLRHVDDHRRGDGGDAQQIFPLHRGQQGQRRQRQPRPVPPPCAVPLFECGAQQA